MHDANRMLTTVSALIDPNTTATILDLADIVRRGWKELGVGDATHAGFTSLTVDAPIMAAARCFSRIAKVESSSIYYLELSVKPLGFPASVTYYPNRDYRFFFSADLREKYLTISGEQESDVLKIWRLLVSFIERIVYAYGWSDARKSGPALSAAGLSFGIESAPTPEDRHSSVCLRKWSADCLQQPHRPERAVAIRSVFPLQWLTSRHLELQLEGRTLRDWIVSDRAHGMLTPANDGLWCWNVPDSNIEKVRGALSKAGLLWGWWPLDGLPSSRGQ